MSGAVTFGAFPPLDAWPLAIVGTAVLFAVVRGATAKHAIALGGIAGLAFFVPLLAWIRVIGDDAWLGLAASQAIGIALLALALAFVDRLPAWPLSVAALWVGEEALRGRVPFGGFTWGRLAFSQGQSPLVHLSSLGGAPAVTFAVALAAAGCYIAGVAAIRRNVRAFVPGGALVAAVLLLPLAIPTPTAGQTKHGAPSAVVALVQGSVPRAGLDAFAQKAAVLNNHVTETLRFADGVAAGTYQSPDAVIWPENSSDLDPFTQPVAAQEITQAAHAVNKPMLIGSVIDGPGPTHVRNAGIVWNPSTGPGAMYVKRHPVPFGEYIPFRSVLTNVIGRFSLIPYDFARGKRPGVLQVGPVRLGDVICFEVAYDNIVRDAVTHGGRIIVVQTNNATFGHSYESDQQLAMSRLRAVEHGRAVLVAATSGISAIVEPNGHVVARSHFFTPQILEARVPLRDSRTLADRLGSWPEMLLTAVGLGFLCLGLWRRRTAR